MFWLFRKGFFGKGPALLSLLITALVLFWLWNAMAPASMLYQIIFLAILAIVGIALFTALVFMFTIATMLLFMLLLRRKVKKGMKKMFDMIER